jgi:hypothetical protein
MVKITYHRNLVKSDLVVTHVTDGEFSQIYWEDLTDVPDDLIMLAFFTAKAEAS